MVARIAGLTPLAPLALLASLAVACVAESTPPPPPEVYSGGGQPPTTTASNAPTEPILVKVDPNVTMTATGGQGVGVFNEYKTGGHWHVWWTCDTSRTNQPCAFDVKVTPQSGELSNVRSDQFVSTDTLTDGAVSLEAVTTTGTNTEGIFFDAVAGVPITLEASVGGLKDGSFLFFVQDGQVNGGYTGQLTDPLMLEGATP
jgi:hypothetical protein